MAVLGRRLLRPFRELAKVLAAPQPARLDEFAGSPVEEVVALAAAVERAQSRLRCSLADVQRDRADMVAIFEYLADAVLVLDADDRVELANPAAARLLGREHLQGRPLPEAVRDPDLLEVARAARQSGPVTQLIELRRPTGGRAWLQVVATQLPTARRLLVLLQDITELRHAAAARRDFVTNVSHDLKTPIASLKALVETLEGGALHDPEAGPDFLRRMHVEVDGLAQLVAELLELARIETRQLDLDLSSCRADELVREAVEHIQPYAARVGLYVALAPAVAADLWVQADVRRVGQIFSNLLANAIKFTPPGGRIEVGAQRVGPVVELWVSDTGVGIAPDQLSRIFERFYKIDPSRTGSGTGLGLAICKHLVRAHGGTIWAESRGLGRGANFRFTLPPSLDDQGGAASVLPELQPAVLAVADPAR